jgi:hypothetical protein
VTSAFHRPALFAGHEFSAFQGGNDPAELNALAHESARALLARVKSDGDARIVERVVTFTDENGIDVVAELWANASPHSLPGSLWRLYLIRALIRAEATQMSFLYGRGLEVIQTVDPVVAGAPSPAGPDEMRELADTILRGAFEGDFSGALDRAASFARVLAAGCTSMANEADLLNPERAGQLTTQAARLSKTAAEFSLCARLWREGSLD